MAGESFDPYDLATQGQNSFSPFTISIQGQLSLEVIIEEIIPTPPFQGNISGGGGSGRKIPKKLRKEKKLKQITVICTIDGVEYKEVAYSKELNITSENVKVQIVEGKKRPKILVEVIK